MKVALFLLNKKGYECLKLIVDSKVYFQHINFFVILDRDKGNAEDYYEEMKEICVESKIPVFKRIDFKKKDVDYGIAIGWRRLIYNVEKLIVLHDSILPRYRGFSPLVNMLINGEEEIGVTALYATDEMDKGAIIDQYKVKINYPIKIKKAIDIISVGYREVFINLIEKIHKGHTIKSYQQNEEVATYSIWRDNADYFIDWNESADSIKRFVDAVGYPYSGAKTYVGDKVVTIIDVDIIKDLNFELIHPGKIIMYKKEKPVVICGSDAIIINKAEVNSQIYEFKKLRIRLG